MSSMTDNTSELLHPMDVIEDSKIMVYNSDNIQIINEDNLPCTPSSNSEHSIISNNTLDINTKVIEEKKYNNNKRQKWEIKQKQEKKEEKEMEYSEYSYRKRRRFPNDLVFGILFSNKYKHEIISLIYSHFRNKPIDINILYQYLLPSLKQSEKYFLYRRYKPELIKYSMSRLFHDFSKKKILKKCNCKSNTESFRIGVQFEYYQQQLIQKILKKSKESLSIPIPEPQSEKDDESEDVDYADESNCFEIKKIKRSPIIIEQYNDNIQDDQVYIPYPDMKQNSRLDDDSQDGDNDNDDGEDLNFEINIQNPSKPKKKQNWKLIPTECVDLPPPYDLNYNIDDDNSDLYLEMDDHENEYEYLDDVINPTNQLNEIDPMNLNPASVDWDPRYYEIMPIIEMDCNNINNYNLDNIYANNDNNYTNSNSKNRNILEEIAKINENILNHIEFLRFKKKDLTKDNRLNDMIAKKKKLNEMVEWKPLPVAVNNVPFNQNQLQPFNYNYYPLSFYSDYSVNNYDVPMIPDNQNEIETEKEIESENKLVDNYNEDQKIHENEGNMNEGEEGILNKCIRCGVRDAQWIYIPCGHLCGCSICSNKSNDKCLFCQKPAQQ